MTVYDIVAKQFVTNLWLPAFFLVQHPFMHWFPLVQEVHCEHLPQDANESVWAPLVGMVFPPWGRQDSTKA